MSSLNATARRAGVLYFLFMIVAIVGEFVLPALVVQGDAAATAQAIAAAEGMYRAKILLGLATHVIFLILVVTLYALFREVDRSQAMLMVVFVVAGVSVALANLVFRLVPLVLLSGADYLSAFTRPQLEALALGFLRVQSNGVILTTAFWGLWLFPFGLLVMKSGFLPRILGILLLIAGAAYLITSVTSIALPASRSVVSRITMPLYMGEVPIIFWLLIKGAGASTPRALSAD